MKKNLKTILILLCVLAVIFFSLKVENLHEHRASHSKAVFDAKAYAGAFWKDNIPAAVENALEITEFIHLLKNAPEKAFEDYSRVLGISKTHYFMLKGSGRIVATDPEFLEIETGDGQRLQIATDFIFGNAVRDGSGKISIDEFLNMTDFNKVSVEINKLVKEKVVQPLKENAEPGKNLQFAGATEINRENYDLNGIRIIPVFAETSD